MKSTLFKLWAVIATAFASVGQSLAASMGANRLSYVPGSQLGAITLLEAAKINSGDVVKSAIIQMFAEESDLLRVLQFENIAGNAIKYNREAALPGVAFRGVNESFSESSGVINPLTEALVIAGGDLDVDRFIVVTQGQSVRSTHERMKIKALSDLWTLKFIKGDSTSNPREFDGLQQRLISGQVISAGATANGAALSISVLDQAIDQVDGATHMIMSKPMRRKFTAAARANIMGNLIWAKDELGRRVQVYDDLPILVAYPNVTSNTDPLAFNEAAQSGTATATSIYPIAIAPGKVQGIQNGTMDVRDLGELQAAPVFRTRVEWFNGIMMENGRAACRIRDIGDLPLVA
jgi:hypothetical protein